MEVQKCYNYFVNMFTICCTAKHTLGPNSYDSSKYLSKEKWKHMLPQRMCTITFMLADEMRAENIFFSA